MDSGQGNIPERTVLKCVCTQETLELTRFFPVLSGARLTSAVQRCSTHLWILNHIANSQSREHSAPYNELPFQCLLCSGLLFLAWASACCPVYTMQPLPLRRCLWNQPCCPPDLSHLCPWVCSTACPTSSSPWPYSCLALLCPLTIHNFTHTLGRCWRDGRTSYCGSMKGV